MTDHSSLPDSNAPARMDDSVPRWLLFPLIALWLALVVFVAIMLSEGSAAPQPPVQVDSQSLQQSLTNLSGALDAPTAADQTEAAPTTAP
ncbi:MAG: hypothetical protein U0670_08380 [Anaerolineae bacterium]